MSKIEKLEENHALTIRGKKTHTKKKLHLKEHLDMLQKEVCDLKNEKKTLKMREEREREKSRLDIEECSTEGCLVIDESDPKPRD